MRVRGTSENILLIELELALELEFLGFGPS
jgi:hypothetical protein